MTDPQEPRSAEPLNAEMKAALTFDPEPEPSGPITRRWWRLGWLSALAVARDRVAALAAHETPAGLDVELLTEVINGTWMRQWMPFPTTQRLFAQSLATEYARLAAARLPAVEGSET